MIFNVYPATFVLALFLTQVAALPQVPSANPVTSSTSTTSLTSTTPSTSSTSSTSSMSWTTPATSPPTTTSQSPYTSSSYCPSSKGTPTPEPNAPSPLRATFDTTFDNASGSLNGVACSNGPNGLVAEFPTFGDIPSFPFIGGAFDIAWNSPNCGGCWNLTNPATGVTISITAIDTAGAGFNIAQEAFTVLNGGQIGQGVFDVVANKVSPSVCGL